MRLAQSARRLLRDPALATLLLIWLLGNVLDVLTTYYGLRLHVGYEAIPLYALLYGRYPFIIGASIKVLVSGLFTAVILWRASRWRLEGYVLFIVADLLILGVLMVNSVTLLHAR